MALLKSTADLKRFVNNVNNSTNWENLSSSVANAEMLFIIPAIGNAFFDELNTDYNSNDQSLSPENEKALVFIQNALAQFTMYLDLQSRIGTVGNAGYVENSADKTTQVRQWVHFGTCKNHYWLGDSWLDKGLAFMESNVDDFESWATSSAYTFFKELFITGTEAFHHLVDIGNSRSTYLALRPWLSDAEDIYIRPILTDELFEDLKGKHKEGTLSSDEKLLVDRINKALAHWTMFEGLPSLNVSKASGSVRVITTNDSISQAMTISKDDRDSLSKSHKRHAETFSNILINYLNAKASSSLFTPYYNQKVLTEKNTRAKPVYKNESSKSFMA